MRNSRRKKIQRRGDKTLDVDITSLLDILVILLVFLLKSYNPSDLKLELAEKLTLPHSLSKQFGNRSLTVQVNKGHEFWVNDKKMGSLKGQQGWSQLKIEIERAYNKDQEELKNIQERSLASQSQKEVLARQKAQLRRVNIVLDQDIPYSLMQRIMNTAATIGYPEFKFIVQGGEQ